MGEERRGQESAAPGEETAVPTSLLSALWVTFRDVLGTFEHVVGVSRARVAILGALMTRGELSQADLQQQLDLDGSSITRHVKALEAEGLLTRRADPRDNRFTLVALTPEGRRSAEELMAKARAYEAALLAEISPDEATDIHHGLQRLRAAAHRAGGGPRVDAATHR